MELQYGDLFQAQISAERMKPPGFEYYIEGILFTGDPVPLFASQAHPHRVLVLAVAADEVLAHRTPASAESRQASVASPPTTVEPGRKEVAASEHGRERRQKTGARRGLERSGSEAGPAGAPDAGEDPSLDAARSQLEDELALYSAEDTVALATRHDEKVTRVPAIASSFSREQIRALGARSVYDVLDVVPGLTVSRDVQGFYRTAIRGQRSAPEVLFLLNGHPLDNFFDGKALANLPIENLERIEVIRGPGAALYGMGAFLGVVNLVTVQSKGVHAALAAGMFETLDGHLSAVEDLGALQIFSDADFLKQTGYRKPIVKDALDQATLFQEQRGPLDPAGYTNDSRTLVNLGAGFSFDAGHQGKVSLSGRYLTETRGALVGLFESVGHDSRLSWQVIQADLGYERRLGTGATLKLRAFLDDQFSRRLFQLTPTNFRTTGPDADQFFPPGLLELNDVGVRTFGLDATTELSFTERNRLSVGATVSRQQLYDYLYETNYTADSRFVGPHLVKPEGLVYPQDRGPGGRARLSLGLFAQDQWTLARKLTLTLGARLDAIELPIAHSDLAATALVPSFTPRVGLVLAASDALVLKMLYGRAFRAPTLQELAEQIPDSNYDRGRFQGNPDLLPATVDTVELGADLVQTAGQSRVRLRGNLFYDGFSNPIAAVDTSGVSVPLRNRERGVNVFGAEGEARLEVSARASAWVNGSWFRAQDNETPAQAFLLTEIPQARFNAGMSMPLGDSLNFDFVVRVGSERRNNSRSVLELTRRYSIPSWSAITAQLRTERLAEHFELALVGQNLFGSDLVDDAPRPDKMTGQVPREGLSAFLTVRASY